MVNLTFKTSAASVPILSKPEIDDLGERIIEDYCPNALVTPQAIDVDHFLERYLGATMDFKYLSHCGLYLGMTIFADTDRVPVFNPEKICAEYISCKAGTVIIDESLLVPAQEHRYRFTGMHEGSHKILHPYYFESLLAKHGTVGSYVPMVQCRVDSTQVASHGRSRLRTERDWIEWQANCLASAMLMPKSMVIKAVRNAERKRLSVNAGLEAVIETFNVSNEAAALRMKDLGLWNTNRR